jgi:hypothetical protein
LPTERDCIVVGHNFLAFTYTYARLPLEGFNLCNFKVCVIPRVFECRYYWTNFVLWPFWNTFFLPMIRIRVPNWTSALNFLYCLNLLRLLSWFQRFRSFHLFFFLLSLCSYLKFLFSSLFVHLLIVLLSLCWSSFRFHQPCIIYVFLLHSLHKPSCTLL